MPIQDYLGSTIGLVGSANTLQTQWTYEPFGGAVQSGTSSNYPFLFGGAQLDPTGYYGNFNPALAHSMSGGAVPYTGAGAPAFGSMGGRTPHSMDRATRAASREEAASRAADAGLAGQGNPGDVSAYLNQTGSPYDVSPGAVAFVLDIPQGDLGGLLVGLGEFLASLFGGGGNNVLIIHTKPKMFGPNGIDRALDVTQAPPQVSRGELWQAKFTVRGIPDQGDDCAGCELLPVPLEAGPLIGMAKGPETELMSRSAQRAEQRMVRYFMKELGITENIKAWDWLHDELHELKKLGVTDSGEILNYLKEHLP